MTRLSPIRCSTNLISQSWLWDAYDKVLAEPALRVSLEAKHGARDHDAPKRAMLLEALASGRF